MTWREAVNEQTQNHQTQKKGKIAAEVVGQHKEGHEEIWGGGEMEGGGYGRSTKETMDEWIDPTVSELILCLFQQEQGKEKT